MFKTDRTNSQMPTTRRLIRLVAVVAAAVVALCPPWKGRVDVETLHTEFAGPHRWLFAPPRMPTFPTPPAPTTKNSFEELLDRANGVPRMNSPEREQFSEELLAQLEELRLPEIARSRIASGFVSFEVDYGRVLLYFVAIAAIATATEMLLRRSANST
jgi:hypothetical protein